MGIWARTARWRHAHGRHARAKARRRHPRAEARRGHARRPLHCERSRNGPGQSGAARYTRAVASEGAGSGGKQQARDQNRHGRGRTARSKAGRRHAHARRRHAWPEARRRHAWHPHRRHCGGGASNERAAKHVDGPTAGFHHRAGACKSASNTRDAYSNRPQWQGSDWQASTRAGCCNALPPGGGMPGRIPGPPPRGAITGGALICTAEPQHQELVQRWTPQAFCARQ